MPWADAATDNAADDADPPPADEPPNTHASSSADDMPEPAIVTTVPARVDVETTGGLNYGRTVVDFAGRTERPNNCDVVIAFDVAATHDALVGAIAALSRLQQVA